MISENEKNEQYYPLETKLFGGITYSVAVAKKESRFLLIIGNGTNAIRDDIKCYDVSLENVSEIYSRAHEYAQKIINSNDPRIAVAVADLDQAD